MAATSGEGKSRTILWCVRRSVSCALTKSLTAICDIEVWYEPFFFSFVARRDAKRRLNLELPNDYYDNEQTFKNVADLLKKFTHCTFTPEFLPYGSVKKRLEESTSSHIFVKDMGSALSKEDYVCLPDGYKHTFLIRHPLRVLHSNRKAMFEQFSLLGLLKGEAAHEETFDLEHDDPFMTEGLLFKDIYDVWKHVRENIDETPIVLDADDLLTKPAEVLPRYCRAVGLPYDESLLRFDAASDNDVFKIWKAPIGPEDLRTVVSAFSKTAASSVEFLPPKTMPGREEVTSDVIRCADQIMEYFEEMYDSRLKV